MDYWENSVQVALGTAGRAVIPVAPASFGAYLRAPTGIRHGTGLFVLTLTGERICAMTRFENRPAPTVRATAIAPEPIASFRAASRSSPSEWSMTTG
jgi:hypothetical protein